MKLTDMTSKKTTLAKLNKVTESRFGFKIDYDALTLQKAEKMRNKIAEAVTAVRRSSAIHTAEQNPQYLEMLIVYEGLSRYIDATNLMESRRRKLKEGEMGQAEAILAAKDMVDTAQDMIEKIGKMQNEQLPALIDSIRDQIGSAQADQFKNQVGAALGTLSQQVGQAREQLDTAARGLTGEADAAPMDMAPGTPDAGMGAEMPPELGGGPDNMGDAMDGDDDGFGGVGAAAGGPEELGRERR